MQAILLDLDDTLVDDRTATSRAFAALLSANPALAARMNEQQALERWLALSSKHWLQYERGLLSFQEQRRERMREFLSTPFNDIEADLAFEPYRSAYEASWTLVPECTEFMRRTAHLPKVVITNGERSQQERKCTATGLRSQLLGLVTPTDCGHWKPHPQIFLAALSLLKVDPSRCLMIGDNSHYDIEPAAKLGMIC
jgi:putative hydrolase of the HAD superfamily